MSANLLYLTSLQDRAEAFQAICLEENYALTVCEPEAAGDCSAFDLIFCDCEVGFDRPIKAIPVVAVYDANNRVAADFGKVANLIDVLAFPFNVVETSARLRCLSRLHMLQTEFELRASTIKTRAITRLPVLAVGSKVDCENLKSQLAPTFQVECAPDDMTGLLRAAQGQWACVIMALSSESRDAASMIRQMRVLDRTRTTPILIQSESTDARCIAALQAGANDVVLIDCLAFELSRRVSALATRKSVLDALRADASKIAPLSDFDHATGLPGATQLMRSMPASLDRLKAQGKPASLLLISVDSLPGMPEGETVPDSVMLALTQVLRRSLRGFDFACRYNLDCFAILMPGADAKGAETVAQRICAEIKSEKVRLMDARKDGTTASIGLATMAASGGAETAAELIETALEALSKAKANGAAQVFAQELKLAA